MKHLVLGSSGQVGSHFVKYLRNFSEDVIEYDIVRTTEEDIRNTNTQNLQHAIEQSDFVYFLAFDVGGSLYMKKYQYTYDFISNNVKIMNNVFDILRITGKPFIFASSQMSNMYHTTYGILKALGEYYTKSLNGIMVRFWNVYGIEHDEAKSHVITDFMMGAIRDNVIKMRTDGEEIRQFLYADDCSECLYTLATKYDEIDKDKNLHVTSFEWISIYALAKLIGEMHNCPIEVGVDKDTLQGAYKNEPDPYILNFWKPKTNIVDGLEVISKEIKCQTKMFRKFGV
jgi:nucleoside-diphosphate-sugar epimerase